MADMIWCDEEATITPEVIALMRGIIPILGPYSPATEAALRYEDAVLQNLCGPMGRVIS